jgi:hypothetical protein
MIVFVDFEASSLSKQSFPLEVGWVFEDERSFSCLIHPAPDWTDWSDKAEAIHRISKSELQREGISAEKVAQMMLDTLSGHDLFASAPSWDGKWLSVLLRAGGLPRHALRLRKSDEAFFEAARQILANTHTEEQIAKLVADVIARSEPSAPAHRALPDARLELRRLQMVRRTSAELAP